MYQKSAEPHGVFDDFSFVSVAASALTAATSFLLSSKIGLAGSLIGAVVAAVISTVATQIYRGMLVASAERIRYVAETGHMAPSHLHARRSASRFIGRLIVFAVIISLLGVLASAAFIAFATRGEGLGPTEWEPSATLEETTEELVEEAKEVKDTVEEVTATTTAQTSASDATDATAEGTESATETATTTPVAPTTSVDETQGEQVVETPTEPVEATTDPAAPVESVAEDLGAVTQQ